MTFYRISMRWVFQKSILDSSRENRTHYVV